MKIQRVAVIFDRETRPETTGVYCLRALESFTNAVHFSPDAVDSVAEGEFDLFLRIDDGLRYEMPSRLRPAAWWAIDTHMDFAWCRDHGSRYDYVFAAQKDGANDLTRAGVNASWLPLACDPQLHHRPSSQKQFDFAFIGNLFPGRRSSLVHLLRERWPSHFVGNRYFEEMAATYAESRLVFNCSIKNDVNMRVFEGVASGSMLITNALDENGQAEILVDGQHLATYASDEELLDKFEFYLSREDVREAIAQAGYSEVIANHTYSHRMQEVLRTVESREAATQSQAKLPAQQTASCSACLLAYKRFDNIHRIVDQLLGLPFIDDIVIWNNNPEEQLRIQHDRVTVIQSHENIGTYGRFLGMQHARHETIYTQDDDCLVHNASHLYSLFQECPDRIVHALKPPHMARVQEREFECGARMAILGWGAVLQRKWCGVLGHYIERHGEDPLLLSKADRIFSILLNRPHLPIDANVTDLPGNSGPEAISVSPDHPRLVAESITRSLELVTDAPPNTVATPNALEESESELGESGRPDTSYFEFDRPDVLELVPREATRILEVGCGAGRLGRSIKARQSAYYIGIEVDPFAASLAMDSLDEVITGNIEQLDWPDIEQVDCVICADVLEHLADPAVVLKKLKTLLAPQGTLIASIPNARHHSVVSSLIAGNWTYEAAGLLDQTHLQFYTRRDIQDLFTESGFEPQSWHIVPGPGFQEWEQQGRPAEVQVGNLAIRGMPAADTEEFFVYQYLVQARPQPIRSPVVAKPDLINSLTVKRAFDLCYYDGVLRGEDTYVEIGANRGVFLSESGLLDHNNKFHLFEPNPAAVEHLKEKFGPYSNVTVHEKAIVGASSETVTLYVDVSDPLCEGNSLHSRGTDDESKLTVAASTLASAMDDLGIDGIRLLAINAEQAEYDILNHSKDVLDRVDFITCEFHPQLSGIDTAFWVKKHLPEFETMALMRAGEPYNIWFGKRRSLTA